MRRQKIERLANFLLEMNLEKEAYELMGLFQRKSASQNFAVSDWYQVLEEIKSPYIDPAYQTLSKYLKSASSYLKESAKGLADATVEDIKNITDNIPIEELISKASQRDSLLKYASEFSSNSLEKVAEFCIKEKWIERPNYKRANWWKYVKTLSGASARFLLPFVSLIFAAINFYYCAVEFSKLMTDIPEAGLSWYEPLQPKRLLEAAEENQENPDLLQKLARAIKTSKIFVDELISLIANSIDGIKDIIFFFSNLASGGLTLPLDLGISFLIMCVEWSIEGKALPLYDQALAYIKDTAIENIKDAHMTEFTNRIQSLQEIPDLEPIS